MNVAYIPARGGSKSIPLKNIKPICGKPLLYWTVKAACDCKYIDIVYVATDSEKIKDTMELYRRTEPEFSKVNIIGRSAESASDTASTEFAMLEFAEKYDFDNIVLIQATSPLLMTDDLNRGFEAFQEPGTDTVLSAVRQKRFNWNINETGYAEPTNYDVFKRPRRQEFEGYLVENGAFYISSKTDLVKYQNRVSGNIKIVEMKEDSFFEIDEPDDWLIIEGLMKKKGLNTDNHKIPDIKMFLTDCDGCLTDGGMYYSENDDELKKFNTRDGMGFAILREKGILSGIVTSENMQLNKRRAKKLKLDILIQGSKNKLEAIKDICKQYDISLENVAYVGDDINDLEVIKAVGYGCCPADAMESVRNIADYVTACNGGMGVIREVVERIFTKEKD